MALSSADRDRVTGILGRELTRSEAALVENLWSEHCAYRSSRPLLTAFESAGENVVVGPGDDAAVVSIPDIEGEQYLALGIESHNHPSYVDPYDGAATGVGGIVRDIISMGAYPIALGDSLYFGPFDRDHSRYLLEGVVDGISDYGNAIGVPTVTGSAVFHEGYVGNPLVNVACVGLLDPDRLVTAAATTPGNKLVLVGNATGRDGLGGASFASEDLAEDAETEDRPAVQVGDPYTEKLLIEANERLLDEDVIQAARDLGAAGLGGATCEMAAKGDAGATIDLESVHQREPGMNATEILLAESQERMCYEVSPEDVETVTAIAERFDLGWSVVGEITASGRYVCHFGGQSVVDVPATLLADGAPTNDLERQLPERPPRDIPSVPPETAFDRVVPSPNTASKRWIYRQYDHEVGLRTARRPGEDAALLAIREARTDGEADAVGLGFTTGSNPLWTDVAPYEGARAVAIEAATNLAVSGALPLAAVDCLNGGNPETSEVYGPFAAMVDGLAEGCRSLKVPVVGGNVSLYNDSPAGPIPPTPTIGMVGTRPGLDTVGSTVSGDGTLLLLGSHDDALGGSELLELFGGHGAFPAPDSDPRPQLERIAHLARTEAIEAIHDVSHGGLAVTLAEMVGSSAGVEASLPSTAAAFGERVGRVVVETKTPDSLEDELSDTMEVMPLGRSIVTPELRLSIEGSELTYTATEIADLRSTLESGLE